MRGLVALAAGGLLGLALACSNFQADLDQYCAERRCGSPADCCAGFACAAGRCVGGTDAGGGGDAGLCPGGCSGATPVCSPSSRSCVVCTAQSCAAGEVCDPTAGCVGCSSSADCSAPTPVCNLLRNTCVECVDDTSCTAPETCNRQLGRCELGGADAGFDAGVAYALRVLPAGGQEFLGRCSGQWRVETVDVRDAGVPFYGPVSLSSSSGTTTYFAAPGCPTASQLSGDELPLEPQTGRASFYFVEAQAQAELILSASYGTLQPGSGRVDVAQEVDALDVQPGSLALTVNTCSATPFRLQLLKAGAPASFSFDTHVTVSAGGALELFAAPGCSARLSNPVPLPAGTQSLTVYPRATGAAYGVSFSAPGVSASATVTVTFPPDSVSVSYGAASILPKGSCVESRVYLLGGGMPVTATADVTVKLASDGTLLLFDGSGCTGPDVTSVEVRILSGAQSASYWLMQPASGPDSAVLTATVPAGGLAGDTANLQFFNAGGMDGGP